MYRQKFGQKYNNTPQLYDGNRYDSKKEAEFAKQLDLRVKAKDIKSWERQVRIPLVVNGYTICYWKIDFKLTHNDDSIEWVEIKGFETYDYIIKRKLFEALKDEISPGSELTVIK